MDTFSMSQSTRVWRDVDATAGAGVTLLAPQPICELGLQHLLAAAALNQVHA